MVSRSMNTDIVVCMTRTLGDFVREKREGLGLSQTELSARADVPRTTVNRIETGTTQLPSPDVRRRLAIALGVSHLDLLIASGEITEEEIAPLGVQGVIEPDPVRAELMDALSRLPLTGERPTTFRRLIDVFSENDRIAGDRSSQEHKNGGGNTRVD